MTFLVGLSLLGPAWIGLSSVGVPTLLHPLPALTVLPILLMHLHPLIVLTLLVVLFFAWNAALFQGNTIVPKRSYIVFAVATVLSVPWFVLGWKFGLQYEGPHYTHQVCALNALWITALCIMLLRRWKRESTYGASLAVHWMLFAWLSWYAFPYLGELP
jgi:hypothetical protein